MTDWQLVRVVRLDVKARSEDHSLDSSSLMSEVASQQGHKV